MSTAIIPPASPDTPFDRPEVLVDNRLVIPSWVRDQHSFRRWAHSDAYPESGWVSFLGGAIYVDMNMEEILTHNQVKHGFNVGIGVLLLQNSTGRFFPDRMLFSNVAAGVTTEPDGMYAHWATMETNQLRFIPGKAGGFIELEGTPDMILEIVSRYSESKDNVRLRNLYEKARIPEYWLVDARENPARFEILRLTGNQYQSVPADDGWIRSDVFGCSFQLVREIDPIGQPLFFVKVKP